MKILKSQYNGFKLDDTLASRIRFTAIFRAWDVSFKIVPHPGKEESKIYTIKDEYGARFGCFNEKLAESILVGETYEVRGSVKIGKGGTFLNIEQAEPLNGSAYKEELNGPTS